MKQVDCRGIRFYLMFVLFSWNIRLLYVVLQNKSLFLLQLEIGHFVETLKQLQKISEDHFENLPLEFFRLRPKP